MAAVTPQGVSGGGTNQPNNVRTNHRNGTALFRPNTDPLVATYYFSTINDADTWTASTTWRQSVPGCVFVSDLGTDSASAIATLSGTTLTITFQTDGAVTGTLELHRQGL